MTSNRTASTDVEDLAVRVAVVGAAVGGVVARDLPAAKQGESGEL